MGDSVVGVWSLKEMEIRTDAGLVRHPFGLTPRGLMILTKDGHFSLQVMDPRRPRFPSGDLFGSTVQERASAMEGYSAYSGTYRVREGWIVIHVQTSLFPNWVGQEEERSFVLEGDTLQMSTQSVLAGGEEVRARVTWKRVSDLG